jgi:hypothetical protein
MLNTGTAMERNPSDPHAAELHRNAYNAAFHELGLNWYWDSATYWDLQSNAEDRDRVLAYLRTRQSHMLRAYDADFLVDAILKAQARCYDSMTAGNALASTNWAEIQRGETGF